MKRLLAPALSALVIFSGSARAALVTGLPVLPAPAAGVDGAAAAAGIRASLPLDAINGISLRSPALTLSSLDALAASLPSLTEPSAKAAAVVALAALSAPPAAIPRIAKAAGLPAAAVDRLQKAAAKLDAGAAKDPAFASKVAAGRGAAAALVSAAVAHPEKVLPADLVAVLRALSDDGGKTAAASAPDAPVVVAPAPTAPSRGGSATTPIDPASRPQVAFGAAKFPVVAQPTIGDDISGLWVTAHKQSASALIAMYNFDDMAMAQEIVAAAKAGKKQVIVGDYSNWFPMRVQTAIDEAKKTGKPLPDQTAAMKFIIANLGPNLELRILKGLGSIGINHNKFTVFTAADGTKLLQSGSFNYTGTSQHNHWENVVFTDDADRLKFYAEYHAWIYRRARPYSPDLQPQEPTMDPNDPIPQDPSRTIVFHGVPFPKASGSPNGGTEAWLVKAESLVRKSLDILMFSPFPTPEMSAAIQALLAKKIPVRLIADRGQVGQAGKVLEPLLRNGLQLKVIVGPDVVLNHQPWSQSSKMHEKVMLFDSGMPDALAKMGDSLNISLNALNHNFENTELWQGFQAAFMAAHFEFVWGLAEAADKVLLDKLAAEASAPSKSGPSQ